MAVVTDLERALRELGVPFGIVGALVPELLLAARPARMTSDVDVTVVVQTLTAFESLKADLARYGCERTGVTHRLRHSNGGLLDILPFSEVMAPGDRLQLDPESSTSGLFLQCHRSLAEASWLLLSLNGQFWTLLGDKRKGQSSPSG